MLSWSDDGYKFTLGIGSLALTGMLSELFERELSVWAVLTITLFPIVVFVFVHPGEMPTRFVQFAHLTASLWYVGTATALLIAYFTDEPARGGWVIYPTFTALGAVPCWLVLSRAVRGRYGPSNPSDECFDERGVVRDESR